MVTITVTQLQDDFERYLDMAQREPVSIEKKGEDSVVIMSAEEYKRLKVYDDRQAVYPWELPNEVIAALDSVEVPEETARFDHEYK